MRNAKDVSALKAVSQNLMHENLTITDGVYGILAEKDVKDQIGMLGYMAGVDKSDQLVPLLEEVLRQLKSRV